MKYENIVRFFLTEVPESSDYYNKHKSAKLIDDNTGVHVVFGMIILPFILESCDKADYVTIDIIFAFLEKMSQCEDVRVVEVLDFTILEGFADEGKERLNRIKKYMWENTLQHCEDIEKYFDTE